jgi:hypothetical protein
MREEPIISGAVVKAALVLLVAGALGVGAYAVAGGDVDLPELPDLPDIDTTGETTALEDTTVEDTTVTEEPEVEVEEPAGPFTTAGLADALAAVEQAVEDQPGAPQLTRLLVNEVQTQFFVRSGDGIEAVSVRADSGEVAREEATITITGDATITDFAFALAAVQPRAIDRMLAAARGRSGAADFTPTTLALERALPFGSRELRWQINAEGGGRSLTYRAKLDGSQVQQVGGGTEIPPAAREARRLSDCIESAGGDADAISECFEEP